MRTVTVTATRAFPYQDRRIAAGEAVDVSPLDAAILHRRGHVSLTLGRASTSAASSPADAEAAPRRRRRSRSVAATTEE